MGTCGRDLERALGGELTAHLRDVEARERPDVGDRVRTRQMRDAAQSLAHLTQMPREQYAMRAAMSAH